MRYCLAIPTYERPQSLSRCLSSIGKQSRQPDEILMIDDGALDPVYIASEKDAAVSRGVSFGYYKKDHGRERRGLSESKNIALEGSKADVVIFLDDDIVLHERFLEKIIGRFEENEDDAKLMGIGGMIAGSRQVSQAEKLYNHIFGLSSVLPWDVTSAGFQVWDDTLTEVSIGHYALGGLCALRREAALSLKFSVFSGGRTGLEDVDFCLRAKRAGYHFLIEPAARADHFHDASSREGEFLSGRKESLNRREIYQTACAHSFGNRALFVWSNFGWVLRQFLAGHFAKCFGMAAGLFGPKL